MANGVAPLPNGPKPPWLRIRLKTGPNYNQVRKLMEGLRLNTVCEEAQCPNIHECWSDRIATFMILGDICTRRCGFCAVTSGRPMAGVDEREPEHVAEVVTTMGLRHAVVTSGDRDDLPEARSSLGTLYPAERRTKAEQSKMVGATRFELATS